MGAWGTELFDDDTTCDVRDEFIEYIEEGHTAEEASTSILAEYKEEFTIEDDLEVMSLVYIGLAAVQLEKNCLVESVRKQTIECIKLGADLELWEEAEKEEFEERKEILHLLKQELENHKR